MANEIKQDTGESDLGTIQIATNRITTDDLPGRGDTHDDSIDSLILSIQSIGLLHPITVSENGDGFRLIAGARRLAAVRALEWQNVPAVVYHGVDNGKAIAINALENLDRKQLDPLDEALMCQNAFNLLKEVDKVAATINRTPNWVTNRLAILEWPDDCIHALRSGALSMSAVAPLATITEPRMRTFYLDQAAANGATTRQTAAWAAEWRANPNAAEHAHPEEGPIRSINARVHAPPTGFCTCCNVEQNLNELNRLPLCGNCSVQLQQAGKAADQAAQEPPKQ